MKSASLNQKIKQALTEANLLNENRRHRPAIIYMKRGTIIPVHHHRKVIGPHGEELLIAGIDPGHHRFLHRSSGAGGYSPRRHWTTKMRDFWAPGNWIPCELYVQRGFQDETGWSEPDEHGRYDATRDFEIICKFRKVLTMNPRNIAKIEPVPPGTDPNSIR